MYATDDFNIISVHWCQEGDLTCDVVCCSCLPTKGLGCPILFSFKLCIFGTNINQILHTRLKYLNWGLIHACLQVMNCMCEWAVTDRTFIAAIKSLISQVIQSKGCAIRWWASNGITTGACALNIAGAAMRHVNSPYLLPLDRCWVAIPIWRHLLCISIAFQNGSTSKGKELLNTVCEVLWHLQYLAAISPCSYPSVCQRVQTSPEAFRWASWLASLVERQYITLPSFMHLPPINAKKPVFTKQR